MSVLQRCKLPVASPMLFCHMTLVFTAYTGVWGRLCFVCLSTGWGGVPPTMDQVGTPAHHHCTGDTPPLHTMAVQGVTPRSDTWWMDPELGGTPRSDTWRMDWN